MLVYFDQSSVYDLDNVNDNELFCVKCNKCEVLQVNSMCKKNLAKNTHNNDTNF